ncbi:MAG: hypothetical protein R2710_04105 [Acidimicrobiales bacterium]
MAQAVADAGRSLRNTGGVDPLDLRHRRQGTGLADPASGRAAPDECL